MTNIEKPETLHIHLHTRDYTHLRYENKRKICKTRNTRESFDLIIYQSRDTRRKTKQNAKCQTNRSETKQSN